MGVLSKNILYIGGEREVCKTASFCTMSALSVLLLSDDRTPALAFVARKCTEESGGSHVSRSNVVYCISEEFWGVGAESCHVST